VTVQLVVDVNAATPVYEQLRAQIAGHIGAGSLHKGDRLPTVRGLAADLGIAVNTVGRAYAELEAAGLVKSGRRAGTVVTGVPASAVSDEAIVAAAAFAAVVVRQTISDDTAVELVRHALRAIRPTPPPI
jgi:GntR family transcriptional regulator